MTVRGSVEDGPIGSRFRAAHRGGVRCGAAHLHLPIFPVGPVLEHSPLRRLRRPGRRPPGLCIHRRPLAGRTGAMGHAVGCARPGDLAVEQTRRRAGPIHTEPGGLIQPLVSVRLPGTGAGTRPDGLLVVGSPKGSTWKYSIAMDSDVLARVPAWLTALFSGCLLRVCHRPFRLGAAPLVPQGAAAAGRRPV